MQVVQRLNGLGTSDFMTTMIASANRAQGGTGSSLLDRGLSILQTAAGGGTTATAPPPPWYQTTGGMVALGAGALAAIGGAFYLMRR
jgi:hypothetical protein